MHDDTNLKARRQICPISSELGRVKGGEGAEVFAMLMFASICVDVFTGVCVHTCVDSL